MQFIINIISIIIISVVVSCFLLSEILYTIYFGWLIRDKKILNNLIKAKNKAKVILLLDKILFIDNFPEIIEIDSRLSTYYIHKVGRVPKWSKTHKVIDKCINELRKGKIIQKIKS